MAVLIQESTNQRDFAANEPPLKKPRCENNPYLGFNTCYRWSYPRLGRVTAIAKRPLNDLLVLGLDLGSIEFWRILDPIISADEEVTSAEDTRQLLCVKHFVAHPDKPISQLAINQAGSRLASFAKDDMCVAIYDLATLDMISVIPLDFGPSFKSSLTCAWFRQGIDDRLAVCAADTSDIYFIDIENSCVTKSEFKVHRAPVVALIYVPRLKGMVSTDTKGLIEIWSPTGDNVNVDFTMKSDTMLYELAKNHSCALALAISPDGTRFAIALYPESKVRIFWLRTGKIAHTITIKGELQARCIAFGRNGKTLLFPTAHGIECIDTETGATIIILGSDDTEKFSEFVTLENDTAANLDTEHAAAANTIIRAQTSRPPLVAALANTNSLYLFARHHNVTGDRVVHDGSLKLKKRGSAKSKVFTKATLHTTLGDITIELYPKLVPKTVENFTTLCQRHYYNNVIFHRVIPGFMIQTGDPRGTGQGGESAWGGTFADEFHRLLNHERPFAVSMANAGPHTNGSQFFITTEAASFLDNKHSVFGNVIDGFDVVRSIEKAETDEKDCPVEQIIILSTTLL